MKRKFTAAAALAAVASLSLAGCSTGGETPAAEESSGPVTISVSGWALVEGNQFQTVADAFEEEYPNVTVELKEYDPSEYNTLLTADLAAGAAPDILAQKEVKYVPTFQEGGQLLDVSDVELPEGLAGTESYEVDGKLYAVPYRQDSWVVYYNKDLFDLAGVDYPDGTWTWEEYAETAAEVDAGLAAAGSAANGAYMHSWADIVPSFAQAQTPGADIFSGDYGYLEPYMEWMIGMQEDGSQVDFNTTKANQLTYQGEFGSQKAAMLPMGTWLIGAIIAQQADGTAEEFAWGIAPAPQFDDSTTGEGDTPVTFGDPTAFAINAAIDEKKLKAAKDFLAFAAGEKAATALAATGNKPALINDAVIEAFFAADGAPSDDLSKFAFGTHDTRPQNPLASNTAAIQGIINDSYTAALSGSSSVEDAIATAEERVKNEVGID